MNISSIMPTGLSRAHFAFTHLIWSAVRCLVSRAQSAEGSRLVSSEHLHKLVEIWRNAGSGCVLASTSSLPYEKQRGF